MKLQASHTSVFRIAFFQVLLLTGPVLRPCVLDLNAQTSQELAKQTNSDDSRQLVLGAVIQRQLEPDKFHNYFVDAKAGQYFRVVVMQKGIDLAVKLIGPDGKKIIEVDSPNQRNGPEPVSVIAALTGRFQLGVRALDVKAVAGDYEIVLQELREPTRLDRDRVTAEKILVDAEHLHAHGTKESLHQALMKYNQALPILRAIGDRWKEGETLIVMGRVRSLLGDMSSAIQLFHEALPLTRLVGDRTGEQAALNSLGNIYESSGESERALHYLDQALNLARELRDRLAQAYTLRNIGSAYTLINSRKALEFQKHALTLARELQERRLEAQILTHLGNLSTRYGEPLAALESYNQALQLDRVSGDLWQEANTLHAIGNVYSSLGERQEALKYYNESLLLHRAAGSRFTEATTLVAIGTTYSSLGEPLIAIRYLEESLLMARVLKNILAEAYALRSIAVAYNQLGEYQKALVHLKRAQQLFPSTQHANAAGVLDLMGTIYRRLGKYDLAVSVLRDAFELSRRADDLISEASILSELGAVYISQGKLEEALSSLHQALSIQRAASAKGPEALTLYRLSLAQQKSGHLEEARTYIEGTVSIVDGIRNRLVDQKLRTSYSASSRIYYELYIDILMQMHRRAPTAGYDALALEVNEHARARSLLETLNESHADIREGVDPALVNRERLVQQRLNAKAERLMRLIGGKPSVEQETEARKEVESLVNEYREIESQIRATSPRYAALTQPQSLKIQEIQQNVLDKDTVLLEYALGEERSYAFLLSNNQLTSYELPKRAEIEDAAHRVYEVLINKTDRLYAQALTDVSRKILEPIADKLTGKRLLIVGDGALQYVPFAALPIPTTSKRGGRAKAAREYQPLILTNETIGLPSASVLAAQRQQRVKSSPATKGLVVMADPVFDSQDQRVKSKDRGASVANNHTPEKQNFDVRPDVERAAAAVGIDTFERLPISRSEAEFITSLVPDGSFLKALDFTASSRLAKSAELSQYQIIHFATHSLLNNQHPELSGIVLSLVDEEGRPQDGFLRLYEIYNLKLNAGLVVLSSCQTALGKDVKGEGLIGLTRGFMYAGVPRVVASMWKVSDAATAELMKRFYKRMLIGGLTPSEALRAAQISLLKERQWEAPYYWAPFVLQGEWK